MVSVMAVNDAMLTAAICYRIINLVESPFAGAGFQIISVAQNSWRIFFSSASCFFVVVEL